MKKQNKVTTNPLRSAPPIFKFGFSDYMSEALAKLSKKFPAYDEKRGRLSDQEQQGFMAYRLIVLGLAYVEKTAPLLMATIKYCEAEGIDQDTHLTGLTEAKFKKKLHTVRGRNK